MAVKFFNPDGYKKMTVEEFWKLYDAKDDYILDAYEFCEADIDGEHVWVPSAEKLMELEIKLEIEEMEAEEEIYKVY